MIITHYRHTWMLVDTEFVRDEEEGEDLRTKYNRKSVELLKKTVYYRVLHAAATVGI